VHLREPANHSIHPTQALWQVGEVLMNAWILYAIITAGITLPLIIWTVFEVGMNGWILVTMVKVGVSRRKGKMPKKNSNPPVDFPAPDCEMGYSWDMLEKVMDADTFAAFSRWMNGQTCSLCDGRVYNYATKEYQPSECFENPHGGVAYRWDVHRFLGIVPGKAIWD
jgi:hypothetical protein